LLSALPDVPATEQLPVLIQHGSKDELVDVGRARQSVETLRDLRVPVTYREYEMGHELNARSLNDLSAWLEEKVLSPIVLAS
jgi:phospholipase/carboxylesterase